MVKRMYEGYTSPEPNAESLRKHENATRGMYDPFVKDNVAIYKPADGKNRIRLLPATWEKADWYAYPLFFHYGIGVDEVAYLCPQKMAGKPCPICETQKSVARSDPDYARELSASPRWGVWLIDRKHEDDGPQFWSMPQSFDKELLAIIKDADSSEMISLADPNEGFDVVYRREGSGIKTKYSGINTAQRPSSLCDDLATGKQWLKFVAANPVPDVLVLYEYDHIAEAFNGVSRRKAKDDDEEDDRASRRASGKDTSARRRKAEPEEDPEDGEEPPFDTDDEEPRSRARAGRLSRRIKEDESEDDEPPARQRRTAAHTEPEEDAGEDEPDAGEDEDAPPARRRRAAPAEETDEDEPPVRRRRAPAAEETDEDEPPVRRRRAAARTEPEDELDDGEDEDEPPVRRRRR